MFHDVISLPTAPEDNQQLHKKRHIGNDNVHVVWSEHGRDYSPRTITSQFNDAHIIVYPLPNGLHRIHIAKKDKVNLFGPLLHGMVVHKKLLPIVVRQTAMNAYRYIRYSSEGTVKPYPHKSLVILLFHDHDRYNNRYALIQEIFAKSNKKQDYSTIAKVIMRAELQQTSERPVSPTPSAGSPPNSPPTSPSVLRKLASSPGLTTAPVGTQIQ